MKGLICSDYVDGANGTPEMLPLPWNTAPKTELYVSSLWRGPPAGSRIIVAMQIIANGKFEVPNQKQKVEYLTLKSMRFKFRTNLFPISNLCLQR